MDASGSKISPLIPWKEYLQPVDTMEGGMHGLEEVLEPEIVEG